MKKLLILLLTIFAVSVTTVEAQKLSKEEKAAQKAKVEAENQALLKRLFETKNLLFVPTSVETKTGGRENITAYKYMRIRPDLFSTDLPLVGQLEVHGGYEIVSNEATKTGYRMVVKCAANGENFTFDLAANAKSGLAALRVKSNKQEDMTFSGAIREN